MNDECCHGKHGDEPCEICDAYAALPNPPREGEYYDEYIARIKGDDSPL